MCPGPGGARANRAADLNKTVSQHAAREMPGLGAYGVIRLMQDNSAQARPARVHNQRHEERLARQARHGIGGVGSGGTHVPTDPEWSEASYNSYHVREDPRGYSDRSPGEWAALAETEARVALIVPSRLIT